METINARVMETAQSVSAYRQFKSVVTVMNDPPQATNGNEIRATANHGAATQPRQWQVKLFPA